MRAYRNLNVTDLAIQQVITLMTNNVRTLTKKRTRELQSAIESAWRQLVTEKVPASKARAYYQGLKVRISEGKISLILRGADALMAEEGWAPPQNNGAAPEDGLGMYDGAAHDMRPFLLYGTTKWNGEAGKGPKYAKEDGHAYKFVRLPMGEGAESTMTDMVRDHLADKISKRHVSTAERGKLEKKAAQTVKWFKANLDIAAADARRNKRNDVRSPPGDPEGAPASGGMRSYKGHGIGPVPYERLRVEHTSGRGKTSKYRFFLLRTINKDNGGWKTVGVPPASIVSEPDGTPGPLFDKIAELFVDQVFDVAVLSLPRTMHMQVKV